MVSRDPFSSLCTMSSIIRRKPLSKDELPPQVIAVEKELLSLVEELHRRTGNPQCILSVDDIVEPPEEREFQMEMERFEGGDEEIVAHVKHLMAVEAGEITEDEESDEEEDEDDPSAGLTIAEIRQMCEKIEAACWKFGYVENGLALTQELRRFRGFLRRMEEKSKKQMTLESYWATRGK